MMQVNKTRAIGKRNQAETWSDDWSVAMRVWIERRGKLMLGEELADVLAAIDRTSSISAAARLLGISYRHAWTLVDAGNTAAGIPLVSAAVGGQKGGGTRLTERGKRSLEIFEQLRGKVRETAANILQQALSPDNDLASALHLASAISLQEVIGELLTEYALRQPSVRVRAVFGASNELADHILAGAPCDLFVSADASHLDRLAAQKRIEARSRTAVAANSLAVIGPESARAISNPRQLLGVKQLVLADPASPLGRCSLAYLDSNALGEALAIKAILVDNSRGVLAAIRSGRADAGLAFASDAAKAGDCKTLLSIDPAKASVSYCAAVCVGKRAKESRELLEFFETPAAQRCFRRCGLALPKAAAK